MNALSRRLTAIERTTSDSGGIVIVQRDENGNYTRDGASYDASRITPILLVQPGALQRLCTLEGDSHARA